MAPKGALLLCLLVAAATVRAATPPGLSCEMKVKPPPVTTTTTAAPDTSGAPLAPKDETIDDKVTCPREDKTKEFKAMRARCIAEKANEAQLHVNCLTLVTDKKITVSRRDGAADTWYVGGVCKTRHHPSVLKAWHSVRALTASYSVAFTVYSLLHLLRHPRLLRLLILVLSRPLVFLPSCLPAFLFSAFPLPGTWSRSDSRRPSQTAGGSPSGASRRSPSLPTSRPGSTGWLTCFR